MMEVRPNTLKSAQKQQHVFICDVCGKEITDRSEVRIIRDSYALPEEPTVFHVHKCCVEQFNASHVGRWVPMALVSPESSMFLW